MSRRRGTSAVRFGFIVSIGPAILAVFYSVLFSFFVGCRQERPRNVVFVLVDTLRADHLGAYGYRRQTSPTFDTLARQSVLFEDARSQSSCTFPSANSLLTSRSPEAFLGQPGRAMGIPAGIRSVAELLSARGFRTVAVSASPIVRRSPSRFNPGGGFGRGFEVFDESCLWQPAECVNRRAAPYLVAEDRPLFLYLHYIDPHGPYAPPTAYRRRFAAAGSQRDFIRRGDPNPIARHLYAGGPDPGVTPDELAHLVDLYDDEIGYFDSQLARLLVALERSGLADDTLLVVAADHGEEFLEHGEVKHCRTVFDTSIHTPLLLRIPGVGAARLRARAQNLDIVPTLLDYLGLDLGLDAAKLGLEGRSLRPAIAGGRRAVNAHQWSAQGSLRSAVGERFKLIHDVATHGFRLYDLVADPGERRDVLHDVLRKDRRSFAELRRALVEHLAATDPSGAGAREAKEAERKLRALGYLE